jgi:hypothetical protein
VPGTPVEHVQAAVRFVREYTTAKGDHNG